MMTNEQAEKIKEKLLLHLKDFPEDQRDFIKEKILSMTNEELEKFLEENSIIYKEETEGQCIFCNIVNKKIPSYIIYEDKENLAVLEINPLSKGHTLIVPKKHLEIEKIPKKSFSLAKKIASKIKSKFNPLEIKINPTKIFSHALIEVIPLYGGEKERKKAPEEELKNLQQILKIEKKQKVQKEKTNLLKLKARIP